MNNEQKVQNQHVSQHSSNEMLPAVHIGYAVYSLNLKSQPLIRFDNLEDAQSELTNSDDAAIIVTEVSEKLKNGGFLIKQERIVSAPQSWIPVKFIPEYDGEYLCHIVRKNECGTFSKYQRVIDFKNMKWYLPKDCRVTHWMIVQPPDRTVTLLEA